MANGPELSRVLAFALPSQNLAACRDGLGYYFEWAKQKELWDKILRNLSHEYRLAYTAGNQHVWAVIHPKVK